MTLTNDLRSAIAETATAAEPALIQLRRALHENPELAFEETETAARIAQELGALGLTPRTQVGRTGVTATIEGGRPGPTLLLRGDMDALPIEEQTGLAFASRNPGKMHACGHDVHSATLVGAAAILKRIAPGLAGNVRLVFQPAEEILGGARAMIADGVLDGVDMALGYHNHPDMAVGRFAYVRGPTYAACDRFDLVIHGKSGHAAYPHTTVDPIVAAAHFITGLQSFISREVSPLHPAVVTVGAIHAGTVHNIIPDSCQLLATVRTLSGPVRAQAEAAIRRFCAGLETTYRVRTDLQWNEGVPPTMNADTVLDKTVAATRAQLGDVVDEAEPSMGAEDFAEFAARVPSFVLRIGSGAPGRDDHLHNSAYQPDEQCIALGAQALARAAATLLS